MQTMNYQLPIAVATVERTMDRKPGIARAVASVNRYVDGRIGQAAESLSRGAIAAARIALANECMTGLGTLIYEVDGAGFPVNVDGVTTRIRVPLPWCRHGWRVWGLRQWEARVLNRLLRRRCEASDRVALFLYVADRNSWHLNRRYDTPAKYAEYWGNQAITPTEWRAVEGRQ